MWLNPLVNFCYIKSYVSVSHHSAIALPNDKPCPIAFPTRKDRRRLASTPYAGFGRAGLRTL